MGQARRIVVLSLALLANLFLICTWCTRPAAFYSERYGLGLGFVGEPADAPLAIARKWTAGQQAPLTPAGLISLVEPLDLGIGIALVVALVLVSTGLAVAWSRLRPATAAAVPRPWRFGQIRVRTVLLLVAIVGLYLGWELESWRTWKVERRLAARVFQSAQDEDRHLGAVRKIRAQLTQLDESRYPAPYRAALRGSMQRQIAYHEALAAAYAKRKIKAMRAVEQPRVPDGPELPISDYSFLLSFNPRGPGPAAVLAAHTEVARRHPDFFFAHRERARILATCPNASLRDAKAAVESATRALELTNGNDLETLEIVAAAYAEAGDFPRAVQWQERALDAAQNFAPALQSAMREHLTLYQAGQPYRDPHLHPSTPPSERVNTQRDN